MNDYRYNSLGAQGSVVLNDAGVTCETASYMGRWKTTTPYAHIEPHPIRCWLTPPAIYFAAVGCALLVLFSAFVLIGEIRSADGLSMAKGTVFAVLLCASAFGLYRSLREWTTEWVIFPASIDGHRVAYARTRRGSKRFDEFTTTLMNRIMAERDSSPQTNAANPTGSIQP